MMARSIKPDTSIIVEKHNGCESIVGFGARDFFVREIDRKTSNEIITRRHYSGTYHRGSFIHLGIFSKGLNGVIQLGPAMNPASQASVVKGTLQSEYLELNRMWLADELPRNSESRAISYAFNYVRHRFPKIAWVQSFADERCGRFGVVYQAANFKFCGEHLSTFWELDGEFFHNSLMTRNPKLTPRAAKVQAAKARAIQHKFRQFRYIFFLRNGFSRRLLKPIKPYPKHASEGSREIRSVPNRKGRVRISDDAPILT